MPKAPKILSDFRSDTVTRPSDAMRRAMAAAPVGDDVMAEDPTVNALERRAAALLGKPAALFVTSGSMGNLLALTLHTGKGEEIIVGANTHIAQHEGASAAQIGVVGQKWIDENDDGGLEPERIARAINPKDVHKARTALVCWEITHNFRGAVIPEWKTVQAGTRLARRHGLKTHLDGARLFNAVVETGISAATYAAPFDSVTFCLSKGLGTPVGSVLCGSRAFIDAARHLRKMLGGGWRQAGILGAAGLYALDHNIKRLPHDHRLARALAHGLTRLPGLTLTQSRVDTNMVYVTYEDPLDRPGRDNLWLTAALMQRGVATFGDRESIRFVTHLDLGPRDVERAVAAAAAILRR